MSDWLKSALFNATTVAVVGGILAFLIRKWLKTAVDYHFKVKLEHEKTLLEVEKQGALDVLAKENAIYPQIVELVYRIRNDLRDSIEAIKNKQRDFSCEPLGGMTFEYSEKLYSFRLYLDRETFQMLHSIKHAAQDAYIHLNKFTRPDGVGGRRLYRLDLDDPEMQRRTEETLPELEALYQTVNAMYEQVVPRIKSHMEGILHRR
jgi:hypothetical protein